MRDIGLRWLVGRLPADKPRAPPISLKALVNAFPPPPRNSVRSLLAQMLLAAGFSPHIDLHRARMESYDVPDPVNEAAQRFDRRAAAAVFAAVSPHLGVRVFPNVRWQTPEPPPSSGGFGFGSGSGSFGFGSSAPESPPWPFHVDDSTGDIPKNQKPGDGLLSSLDLLEMKFYGDAAPTVFIATVKCLAAMAYQDYFPDTRYNKLRDLVSSALVAAGPGWCGTYGPGVGIKELLTDWLEGNYDMSLMHLIPLAYRYSCELSAEAREHLITVVLARGTVHRVHLNDIFTSGRVPNDWSWAGVVFGNRLGETENHILMIATARYLTNQLLYQRTKSIEFDNRRNGSDYAPSCMDQVLYLLRNILLDDFSEYNAKSYQTETRTALLNLCSYSYDHEVRLAARMVLDYVAAHMAVSSNDARRMVPFRRRNEGRNVSHLIDLLGRGDEMTIGLVEWQRGADPMTEHMAMQSGATRVFGTASEPFRPFCWMIASDGGDSTLEMLSDYRLPPVIHDLFVNDLHRRFFQRLHRTPQDDEDVTGRNVDNYEWYAGSPSYLISAGGQPAGYAINPYVFGFVVGGRKQDQQLGVAVPTSFMPTGESAGNNPAPPDEAPAPPYEAKVGFEADATNLIQFGYFSQDQIVRNYGVAPDFACGPNVYIPDWCLEAIHPQHRLGQFDFVNKSGPPGRPGFYLALLRDGLFTVLEAFDTWLHPDLSFDEFRASVWARNKHLSDSGLPRIDEAVYTTQNGNRITFRIWNHPDGARWNNGAEILDIEYGKVDWSDAIGNLRRGEADWFLRGTILNSPTPGLVEIANPFLGQKIVLDIRDQGRPRRIAENNLLEAAGDRQEVWVDFDWHAVDADGNEIASEGDFFRPFTTLEDAVQAVQDGGVIKIVPGSTAERTSLKPGKRFRLSAPIGQVRIGVRVDS